MKLTRHTKGRGYRLLAAVGLTTAVALAMAGCAGASSTSGSSQSLSGKDLSITFIAKNLGNPYFDASSAGGKEAVKALGGTFAQVGPSTADPNSQVPYIQTAAQKGAKAIVISANDPTAVGTALTQAKSAGTKVVTFDSDTDAKYRDVFVSQASAEGIAKAQIDIVAKQIDSKGEIAILSAAANATNQNTWIDLMKKYLKSNYPDIKLVATVYGNDDQTSYDKTSALLQTYPNLKGIISPTTVGIAAAARYLQPSGAKGKVALTGLGTPNQVREYAKSGVVKEFALWDPTNLGYLAAYTAAALIEGKITGKQGDTFEAGKLGKFTAGADNTVLLGDPTVFNSSNISKFNF